ncbi:hypothetical protein HYALB_00012983 [Hymenoscyphus albidus]|uniref:Uncharacterized protein n=1 Tax=Hymenoscyphus albidus TaxID=595503 RepID=A0A9N9LRE9_9HELO|nr:hypothetical protein HYALB_00012983 [Hymenoscyphus albidus]
MRVGRGGIERILSLWTEATWGEAPTGRIRQWRRRSRTREPEVELDGGRAVEVLEQRQVIRDRQTRDYGESRGHGRGGRRMAKEEK